MTQEPDNKEEKMSIQCFIEDFSDGDFEAEGILHQDVSIVSGDEMEELDLEVDMWYEIEGYPLERDKGESVKIQVVSMEDIEKIGPEVDDWLGHMNTRNTHSRTRRTSGGTQSGTLHQFSSVGASGSAESFAASTDSANLRSSPAAQQDMSAGQSDISGFATGGGKDVNNFRDNVDQGYRPHPDSISHEGLFYEYEFNLHGEEKDSMFYPVYEQAVEEELHGDSDEHYVAVGLESGIESFERPPLDLMLVVDISGSMGRSIDKYYYDGAEEPSGRDTGSVSKIEATREVLNSIVSKLDSEDRFGIALYNNQGWVSKPLRLVSRTDVDAIMDHIDELNDGGGTDMIEGYEKAVTEMVDFAEVDTEDMARESRVMFLTDAMPNTGQTDKYEIAEKMEERAEQGIHTTYIGIGVDANPELISQLSSIKGSNHYFVSSEQEFEEKVADGFEYITTPLVFDLKLTVEGQGFNINGVYGSPNEDSQTTGDVMSVKTLFPSTGDEGTKGGVILVELDSENPEPEVRLSASWRTRDGSENADVRTIDIDNHHPTHYDSDEVRKAVVLKRYVDTLQQWLSTYDDHGNISEWERKSNPIDLTEDQRSRIESLKEYMEDNSDHLSDSFDQELETVDQILGED